MKLKKLDLYIISKFLGTFFFAILLIVSIAVVFDFTEKIDDFMESKAPFKAVLFDYYLNFVPYFAVLFSSMFIFISVVFFTSRMAYNTEIIAILSSGISFNRLLYPYFLSAIVIASFSFLLNNYVIPKANKVRFEFEEVYYHNRPIRYSDKNVHKQVRPGIYIYIETYRVTSKTGYNFSIEKFNGNALESKLFAERLIWNDETDKWTIHDYYIRDYREEHEELTFGKSIDSTIYIHPNDFTQRDNIVETMSLKELNDFIELQRMQGSTNIAQLLIEKHKRLAFPFSAFILTLIGVSVSSRKVRGGIGGHIASGLAVVFGYIVFLQFSSQYAIKGTLSPVLAAWLPNAVFAVIAFYLYRMAPK
jgi:lipopolysaccharide export system permease protein